MKGESARIITVDGDKALRRHFIDMEFSPRTTVTLVKVAPMGDPLELNIRDYELTLRVKDITMITAN